MLLLGTTGGPASADFIGRYTILRAAMALAAEARYSALQGAAFAMGMFQVEVGVSNPRTPAVAFEERFWVDTGALYSFVPGDRLEQIGIEPRWTRDLILADGRHERCRLGEAVFTIADLQESLTCLVVFGPPGSLYLLGATALENFGVEADPANGRLRPIAAIIGGFRGSAAHWT